MHFIVGSDSRNCPEAQIPYRQRRPIRIASAAHDFGDSGVTLIALHVTGTAPLRMSATCPVAAFMMV